MLPKIIDTTDFSDIGFMSELCYVFLS